MASLSRKLGFYSALPGESDTKQFFLSEYFSLLLSVIIPSESPYSSTCHPVNGQWVHCRLQFHKSYPYTTTNIKIHAIKFKVCIVFVCLLTANKKRNYTKYDILAVNRMLPFMKFTSSEVNFGRREVVNPSALLFASTLSFTTLG